MIFTVVMADPAEAILADIWTNAPNRQAVTDASNRIDKELRVDAHRKGIPFQDSRIYVDSPLAVTYTVDLDDRMVKISQVFRIK